MHFLKTLFWVLLAVVTVIFSLRNWTPVSINLWAGLSVDVKLPILILIGMLIGFVPTYAIHRTKMWRMNRRIDTIERNGLVANSPIAAPAAVVSSQATPVAVPPVTTPGMLDI